MPVGKPVVIKGTAKFANASFQGFRNNDADKAFASGQMRFKPGLAQVDGHTLDLTISNHYDKYVLTTADTVKNIFVPGTGHPADLLTLYDGAIVELFFASTPEVVMTGNIGRATAGARVANSSARFMFLASSANWYELIP